MLNTGKQLQKGLSDYSTIKFPVASDNDERIGIGVIKYKKSQPVIENNDILQGVIFLIESTGASYSDIQIWAFRESCKRENVTCQELIDGYWKAYSDRFVGKEGIQWRHIWNHIEVARKGDSRKVYTYFEMVDMVTSGKYPQSAFTQIDELDSNGHKKWVLR